MKDSREEHTAATVYLEDVLPNLVLSLPSSLLITRSVTGCSVLSTLEGEKLMLLLTRLSVFCRVSEFLLSWYFWCAFSTFWS